MLRRSWQRWAVAILVFLISAGYQRITGPTFPLRGKVQVGAETIRYRLARSHGGTDDHRVTVHVSDPKTQGILSCKRFRTDDLWIDTPMQREGGDLVGYLPHQLPAGKLLYKIRLQSESGAVIVPPGGPVDIRFKGAVPKVFLYTHILFMSLAMIFSNRAGLEALSRFGRSRKLVIWTVVTLVLGGIILGPIVQKYAFGNWWTGFPFGHDLTDNKTALAFLFWLGALWGGRKGRKARGWIVAAAIVMLGVYLIPHSVLGSELDYAKTRNL